MEKDIEAQAEESKQLSVTTQQQNQLINQYNTGKQSCSAWRARIKTVTSTLKEAASAREELDKAMTKKQSSLDFFTDEKQKNVEAQEKLQKAREDCEIAKRKMNQSIADYEQKLREFNFNLEEARALTKELTTRIKERNENIKTLKEDIECIQKRIINIKTAHFYMLKMLRNHHSQLQNELQALTMLTLH